jgi:poly(3-hydroxybutyrate) depolymerase
MFFVRRGINRAAQQPYSIAGRYSNSARKGAKNVGLKDARPPWPVESLLDHFNKARAREILKQWTDVHGLSNAPSLRTMVDGFPRAMWSEGSEELIESYTITHMAHGTPLATSDSEFACGVSGRSCWTLGFRRLSTA